MNVEYINLSNGTTIVTDENGKMKKRDIVSEDTLILENKIEKIQDDEDKIKKSIKRTDNAIKYFKKMLLRLPLIVVISILAGYGAGMIFELAVPGAIIGLIVSGLASVAVASSFSASLIGENVNRKDLKINLESIQNIKADLEKKIELAQNNSNENNIRITPEPISLREKSEIELSKLKDEINVACENVKEEKGAQKKLVFKKEKK